MTADSAHPVLDALAREWHAGRSVAAATVISVHGSSPREPGAMLAVRHDGTVVGSISGGCVEGALYETALEVLADGHSRIETYGPTGDLLAPGLTCGGSLSVLVERIDREAMPQLGAVAAAAARDETIVLETVLDGPARGTHRVRARADNEHSGIDAHGNLVRCFVSRPRMIVVGSTDFAAETGRLAQALGYRVTVCDARPVFTTRARFPDVDDVVCEWPSDYVAREREAGRFDSRTAVVVLTHDPKIDVPVLLECLDDARWPVPPAYVGAMGSLTADANRRRALTDAGLSARQLEALSSPVGLDIGNRGPAETAVSIAAEIIARRR
ncbi:XdhC/CoxI family protein [Rhodococcus sp. HNM0569]|uniref:XdhC family protein n=1 Tax=Rhodococcus sp. HNM0569 TaxID=2716340 RepID=UPI00146A5CF5|nr:XdhC/CoxI family protein [Rhodococcus sp. HNM0569]NLU82215.1 XdhC family protein [Rhodococcus sp. HNM0569]